MMIVACSIVVRRAASGAVLCTALVKASLINGASLPIERASSRIGTTRATTTQPVVLVPAARTSCISGSFASSDRLAEVPDRLQARIDRGQPVRHGAGQLRDGLDPTGGRDERRAYRPEVEDDPQQAHGGNRDNQRSDDQCHPGSCWHDRSPSTQPRSLATEPAYRTAPTATSLMVVSVLASASGTPLSSPMRATPPLRISSVAPRMRSAAASTRLSRKMTTGSTTSNRTALPIHHKTMVRSPQLAAW